MRIKRLVVLLTAFALVLSLAAPVTAASPKVKADSEASRGDNFPGELAQKQMKLKQKAQQLVLTGKVKPSGPNKVVKIGRGQYVELAFKGEDQILTLLAEFGDAPATHNHGATLPSVAHGGGPGPLHNQIPQPNRKVDNTTIWTKDFNQAHYDTLLYSKTAFPSMANYYLEQSSGQYSVDGYVSDWVKVPNNAAAYGSNYCGGIVCTRDVGRFVEDQADGWYASMLASMTPAQIDAFLKPFDVWDRYDFNGNGNFDEPDGYIDHFQSVHAGEGEETGGGALGTNAIWSHRSYVNSVPIGSAGPPGGPPFGGARIGNSSYWIGDYTVEPENGGVGVFAHEFAHDLNLPDEYETSGNTGGAENSTAWWTLMSQGSYGTQNGVDLGSAPVHMNAWDKFQLGFLDNYAVASSDGTGAIKLGPAEYNTKYPQALFVVLPDKEVAVDLGAAYEGTHYYYSDAGNNLDNSMTRTVTLPAAGPGVDLEFNARVRYQIELDWDYAYLTVNGNGVLTNRSTSFDPNGQNFGNGITGTSAGAWIPLTADLSAYAGQTVQIGFRYWTDVAATEPGFQVDAVEIPGQALDGAEAAAGWTFDGFRTTTGQETAFYFNAYVAEFRQYRLYDKSLQTGPYNFGFLNNPALENYVEHMPYQEGLLISYWDDSYAAAEDNNVADHPGSGWILPIDSHPKALHWSDGTLMRPRINSFDSTFGLNPTKKITLHKNSVPTTIPSRPGVAVFDDTKDWWFATDGHAHAGETYKVGWIGVKVPKTGTTIRAGANAGSFMWVYVNQ